MLSHVVSLQLLVAAVVTGAVQRARSTDRERGIVSVEYIVLGAAVIAIVGFLATNGAVRNALSTAFTSLFEKAGSSV